jgi:hypothetical protein
MFSVKRGGKFEKIFLGRFSDKLKKIKNIGKKKETDSSKKLVI